MTPFVKKSIVVVAFIVIVSAYLGYQKTQKLVAIFDKMTMRPNGLPTNVRVNFSNPYQPTVSFDIDVKLTNPTGEDFAVSGYIATLTQIAVFVRGQFLGYAAVNIDEISVPAYSSTVLPKIPITVTTSTLLQNFASIFPELQDLSNINLNSLSFVGVIEVLGASYQIGEA